MSDLAVSIPGSDPPLPAAGPRPRRRRRPRLRGLLVRAHRWGSFSLGLLLLVIVISGAILLLRPEIEQVTQPALYDTDPGPAKVAPGDALATVHRELPGFELAGTTAWRNRGAWEVLGDGEIARVDDTSGRLLGTVDREHGVMGFLSNLHECALGCEGMTGYVPSLAKPAQIDGFDLTLGNEGTWGGFILLLSGLLLLLLVVSGLVLWWPKRSRLRRGFTVRRGSGRYKLHYDLHKVVGFVALPFLAMWAITGINFELPDQGSDLWYAVTPGSAPPEEEFESKPGSGPGITMREAIESASAEVPSGSRLEAVSNPIRAEATSSYVVWLSHGVDPYAYGEAPGNYGVSVDRYSGRAERFWPGATNDNLTGTFWQGWMAPLHMGNVVGWIPRLGFLAFGLTPLLLAVTGTVTWLLRRRLRRRKSGGAGTGGDGAGGSGSAVAA